MKKTFWPHAAAGANRISCVKNSRKKREFHASARHETIGSLAKFIGIAIAKGSSMRTLIRKLFAAMLVVTAILQANAQGSLDYDQESATGPTAPDGIDFLNIQNYESLTQSFVPASSAIDFVQLEFTDLPNNGNNGATVYVNLWMGSPNISSAMLLGSTTPVYMPNGFGETTAGVSTFDFSSAVALIPGDTYYIEPVVSSGDNPWDVMVLGNTGSFTDAYPEGQLYINGSPVTGNLDFWFREGVVSVPEPSTLALIGFGGLLVFAFKRRSKLPLLLLASALLTVPVLSLKAAPDSVVQATADAAGLSPVSTAALPRTGTFWVTTINPNSGLITLPPYPMLPTNMTDLPIFSITNDIFLVDDTGGKISSSSTERMTSAEASSVVQAQSQTVENLIEMIEAPPIPSTNGETGGTNVIIRSHLPKVMDTTNAWLEATNESPNLGLLLENAIGGDNYQLLNTTNLLNTNWDLGQILSGVSAGEDNFTPVPETNMMMFYRVHHANPIMAIFTGQTATEPTNNSDPGIVGTVFINNEWNAAVNNITVYYTISGTARNGVDYSNITDTAIIPANQNQVQININPIADGLKPDQTIIFSLKQNTNYLIDPVSDLATNTLFANPEVYPDAFGDTIPNICPNNPFPIQLGASDPLGLTPIFKILTWPAHGRLNTNGMPNCIYTPTNCYEGDDSFTFDVTEGAYTSTPAAVSMSISDAVFANQVAVQTCRGTPTSPFSLGGDNCSEATNYAILSGPERGVITGTVANAVYIPTGTNTGTDTFTFVVYDNCGDSATNTGTINIGDVNVNPNSQVFMSGTNQPLNITLTASDNSDTCTADTNNYVYAISSPPANGTVSGSGINRIYTPNHNFEGLDSFQFIVSDGVWTNSPASISIFVVAAPTLKTVCDPFGTAVQLNWSLDTNIFNMFNQGLNFTDFVLYRSTNSAQRGVPIYIDNNLGETNYWDTNSIVGQAYYYTLNFESLESVGTNESPFSNQIVTSGQNPDDLIQANSYWEVVTNLSQPSHVTRMQTPLSNLWPQQYPFLYPLPNTNWNSGTTWSNYTTLVIPTNTPLSQVKFSVAIDNEYSLTVNGTFVGTGTDNGLALWSSFQSFPTNVLHYGTNNVDVQIVDFDQPNYFSMVVTTNTCGWSPD